SPKRSSPRSSVRPQPRHLERPLAAGSKTWGMRRLCASPDAGRYFLSDQSLPAVAQLSRRISVMMMSTDSGLHESVSQVTRVTASTNARFCSTVRPSNIWTLNVGMVSPRWLGLATKIGTDTVELANERRPLGDPFDGAAVAQLFGGERDHAVSRPMQRRIAALRRDLNPARLDERGCEHVRFRYRAAEHYGAVVAQQHGRLPAERSHERLAFMRADGDDCAIQIRNLT